MTTNNQKTICLLQITRFGDLLQTLQAASALKEEYPEVRLLLIARKQFGSPLLFLLEKTFDRIVLLDPQSILSSPALDQQMLQLNSFLSEIEDESISALVNLSYSKSSSYLTSVIPAIHKLGPHFNENANLIIKDKWSQFVYSNVMGGPLNPFSLVDIFKLTLGCKLKGYTPRQNPISDLILTIHPFASLEKKKWKAHKWRDIIYKMLKDSPKLIINIVGDKNEVTESREILDSPILQTYRSRINNHVGKLSIEGTYELLGQSKIFAGHDSMVGNLASHIGMPILSIPLGSVRPIETAPYGDNTFSLAPKIKCFPCFADTPCDHFQCHSDIPYQVICSSLQQLLQTGDLNSDNIKANNSPFHLASVELYKTDFSSIDRLCFEKISNEAFSMKEILQKFYRITWLYLLGETEEFTTFPTVSPKVHQQLLSYLPGIQHIFELCEFGKKYCRFILEEVSSESPNINQVKDYSKNIDDIDKLMIGLKNTFPGLSPIIDYYSIIKGNTAGGNVVELTQHSFLNYDEVASAISIFYELTEKTIAEYKIHSASQTTRSL